MRIFVDTSALIALLDEDDDRHTEASAVFRYWASMADLVTHNYVLVEALAVASRRLGRAAADRLTDAFFPIITVVWIDEPLHQGALAAQRAAADSASLVDHLSFLLMRERGIEVAFAYDADFWAQGYRPPQVPDGPHLVNEPTTAYGSDASPTGDLVSVTEIAARTGRPINTIQSWRRRHRDFPAPATQLAAAPIWNWPAVAQWIADRPTRRLPTRT